MIEFVLKKIDELREKEPRKVEIRTPPRKNPGVPYISLASIVRADEKIVVVEYDDAIVVWVVK